MATAVDVNARDLWLSERTQGIGASDSPAVLGVSPYKRPFEVWAEKCGLLDSPDLSDNEAVEFGLRLERPIAEAFAERTGRPVSLWPQYTIVKAPERQWFMCTPDALQTDDAGRDGVLQIKTTSAFNASDWQEGPPLYYQVQLQHELAVTGYAWGTLVVLIGGQRLRYFDCERNDRFIDALVPQLEAFWQRVQTRTPPEVDGTLATAKALAKLHPDDNGETVALPAEAAEWDRCLAEHKAKIAELEQVKTELENRIKAALGGATFGALPDGSLYSWKTQERKGYEVKASKCRVLRRLK